jgi:mannose-6-phosphate isomerase-like protein (cupin superfamily)
MDLAGVVAGERVLLVSAREPAVDPAVLDGLEEALRARGAAVERFESAPFDPRREDAPPALADALARADVVFDLADHESLVHTPAGRREVRGRGLRLIAVALHTVEEWRSVFARFPLERLFARAQRAALRVGAGGRARLRSPNGTDLSFDIVPGRVMGMPGGPEPAPLGPGRGGFSLFPPGAIGTSPGFSEGTIVLDGLLGFAGALPEPITLRVADSRVVAVEGAGREAAWLRREMARHDNGGHVAKIVVGIHPAARIDRGLAELDRRKARLSRAEGVVLVGLGDARSVGGEVASTWHWDGVILPPLDLDVDGRPLVRHGVLQVGIEVAAWTDVRADEPHHPRLVARAGELAVVVVDARGPMSHLHRNLECDELWVPLEGAPLSMNVEGADAGTLAVGQAALVPRGAVHRVDGGDEHAPMLVIERLGPSAPAPPVDERGGLRRLDMAPLFAAPTPHWSRPARPLLVGSSFAVEGYARAEGMLRPEETLAAPEVWIPLRGALHVEVKGAAPEEVRLGQVVSLPAGVPLTVISVRPDTVALRVRLP